LKIDREDFKRLLKEKGLKMTRQRLVVLEVLAESPEQHLTAEEIYERIKAANPDIGLATVYRTVQLLLELELIDRINLDDGFVRYEIGDMEKKRRHHRHHHLICLKCGRVSAFQEDMLEALETGVQEALGFQVTDHEVKLYGYCRDCSEKEKRENQEEKI
jgi:Fur family ferric uptake transcriptional regulator